MSNVHEKADGLQSDLNLLSFIQPIQLVTKQDHDTYRKNICDLILQQIRDAQRSKRVESLRQQMQQNRLKSSSMSAGEESVASDLLLSTDTFSSDSEGSDEEPQKVLSSGSHHRPSVMVSPPKSITSEEMESTPNIRVPVKKFQRSVPHISPQKSPSLGLAPLQVPSKPMLTDEVFWELLIPQGTRILDSKLFFFSRNLWKITFGVNNHHLEYYYVFVSPAEKLSAEFSMHCEFILHPYSNSKADYKRSTAEPYVFPMRMNTSKGFEKFIGPEVQDYLSAERKLRLSVVLTAPMVQASEQQGKASH